MSRMACRATVCAVMVMCLASHAETGDVLETHLSELRLESKTFTEAIELIASRSDRTFVIGLEKGNQREKAITTVLPEGPVGAMLQRLCAADGGYSLAGVVGRVIQIRPTKQTPIVSEVLQLAVARFSIDVTEWPSNVLTRAPDFVPELGAFLSRKVVDHAKKTGRVIPGTPGVSTMSTVRVPRLALNLQGTDVRGVLNAISNYSFDSAYRTETFDIRPVGWKVEFVSDPEAFTGIDGRLRWMPLPE